MKSWTTSGRRSAARGRSRPRSRARRKATRWIPDQKRVSSDTLGLTSSSTTKQFQYAQAEAQHEALNWKGRAFDRNQVALSLTRGPDSI